MRVTVLSLLLAACSEPIQASSVQETTLEPAASTSRAEGHDDDAKRGYVGVLTPKESNEVIASFTSKVDQMLVKLGDRVDEGQALAHLDDRPLREELKAAGAKLRQAQAEASRAYLASRASRATLAHERTALQQGVESKADVERAGFSASQASAGAGGAEAAVEEQQARIDELKRKLNDTTLVAPHGGKVALIYAQQGAHVEQSAPVVLVIGDELFVRFAIPADEVGKVSESDEVDIVIEQQGIRTRGIVRHIMPQIDPVAQMILAEAELVTMPSHLQSGVVCRVVPKPGRVVDHPAPAK